MKKDAPFSVSVNAIRRANEKMMNRNNVICEGNYTGEITIMVSRGNLNISRILSKEKINAAYEKSLKEYAEKL